MFHGCPPLSEKHSTNPSKETCCVIWGKMQCSGCLKSSQTLRFGQKMSPGDGQRCPVCLPGWPEPRAQWAVGVMTGLGLDWAGLGSLDGSSFFQTVTHSPGREGDRPKTCLVCLGDIVSRRESQDFIFFSMFLKVMLSAGTRSGCLMWWSSRQPQLHPGYWEQGIPIAFNLTITWRCSCNTASCT